MCANSIGFDFLGLLVVVAGDVVVLLMVVVADTLFSIACIIRYFLASSWLQTFSKRHNRAKVAVVTWALGLRASGKLDFLVRSVDVSIVLNAELTGANVVPRVEAVEVEKIGDSVRPVFSYSDTL